MISIARHRSSLAVGNIVGSAISNILGAFSLGLIFRKGESSIVFDRSSKIYTLLLLVLTTLIAGLSEFGHRDGWRIAGGFVIGVFAVYIASIAWLIARGLVAAPELSDSESDSDSDSYSSSDSSDDEEEVVGQEGTRSHQDGNKATDRTGEVLNRPPSTIDTSHDAAVPESTIQSSAQMRPPAIDSAPSESTALLAPEHIQGTSSQTPQRISYKHSILYHIGNLVLGFLAVLLSSYVLSHAATNLVDELGFSDVLFGVVILSLATTLPEKFVAIISSRRGHAGILVANTAGSNIFLLSLCIGITWLSTGGEFDQGSVNTVEVAVMLASTVAMTFVVWFGARWSRPIGVLMLLGYIAFLVLEFTVIRK